MMKMMTIRINHVLICFTLCMVIFGCRDSLSLVPESTHVSENGKVPVHLVVGGLSATSRTITPDHITLQDLENPARYKVILDGTSNMGDTIRLNPVSFTHGMVELDLNPGIWTLRLFVTDVNTQTQILTASSVLLVQSKPVFTTLTLEPIQGGTGTGTVNVTFTLSDSIMQRLDKDTATGNATITIALYDTLQQEVPGTKQVFSQAATGASVPLSYMANNNPLTAGRYSIKLESSYTVQNSLTQNLPMKYEMGYTDILYVEGNRETSASIELTSNSKDLGVPENPYRRDKYSLNGSSNTQNFQQATSFSPWGETAWARGSNWDNESSGSVNGNEIFVAAWHPVFNADFYEIEFLIYPFLKATSGVSGGSTTANGKLRAVVTNDSEWDALKKADFVFNGQTRKPSYLRFTGDPTDPDYYKTHYDTIEFDGGRFLTCADANLATKIFVDSSITANVGNARYRVVNSTNVTTWRNYGAFAGVKIGLEGNCGTLGIILPAFAPRSSLVFRVRAVNSYGYSDWVYWKGGRN